VIPIASYNPKYGVTLSLPSVLGRHGVSQVFEPEMSEEERQGLQRNADILRNAVARMNQLLAQRPARQAGQDSCFRYLSYPVPLRGLRLALATCCRGPDYIRRDGSPSHMKPQFGARKASEAG